MKPLIIHLALVILNNPEHCGYYDMMQAPIAEYPSVVSQKEYWIYNENAVLGCVIPIT